MGDYISLTWPEYGHSAVIWDGVSSEASENFNQKGFEKEKKFLEELRFDYGFRTQEQILASSEIGKIWLIENKDIATPAIYGTFKITGVKTINIRYFPGKPSYTRELFDLNADETLFVLSHYNTSYYNELLVYNEKSNQSYLLYFDREYKDGLENIIKYGDNLLMNRTVDENKNLILINTKTLKIRTLEHTFDIINGEIVIDDVIKSALEELK